MEGEFSSQWTIAGLLTLAPSLLCWLVCCPGSVLSYSNEVWSP